MLYITGDISIKAIDNYTTHTSLAPEIHLILNFQFFYDLRGVKQGGHPYPTMPNAMLSKPGSWQQSTANSRSSHAINQQKRALLPPSLDKPSCSAFKSLNQSYSPPL
jgi:hypothetical protein